MRSKLFTLGGIAVMGALTITPAAGAATKPKPKTATKASVDALAKKVDTLNTAFGPLKNNVDQLKAIGDAAPLIVAGLTTLGDAFQSVEYGMVQATSPTTGVTFQTVPSFTSDIPDDGNGTTTQGTALLFTNSQKQVSVNISALVRSNETDVDGTGGPVAEAGGFLYVENGIPNATATAQPGNPGQQGAFNPGGYAGGQAGTAGTAAQIQTCQNLNLPATQTPTGAAIETPSGTVTNQPLVNLDTGVPRTSQVGPADANPAVKTITPGCDFTAVPGIPYIIHFQATFVDIPRSTSPGPKE